VIIQFVGSRPKGNQVHRKGCDPAGLAQPRGGSGSDPAHDLIHEPYEGRIGAPAADADPRMTSSGTAHDPRMDSSGAPQQRPLYAAELGAHGYGADPMPAQTEPPPEDGGTSLVKGIFNRVKGTGSAFASGWQSFADTMDTIFVPEGDEKRPSQSTDAGQNPVDVQHGSEGPASI
jgi:hypothetical protein